MDNQSHVQHVKKALESFFQMFKEYAKEIYGDHRQEHLNELRGCLQQQEPEVTSYVLGILGDSAFAFGSFGYRSTLCRRDLLSTALLGGNNELPLNFHDYEAMITSTLNKAIGTIEAGLWPPQEPKPILLIEDDELRQRCSDLLTAPGNYDRVVREATTILEDRIRSRCPHDILSRLIPQSAAQSGENLVNKIFAPDHPILSISSDRYKRIAFHRIMLGMVSYLRNPYHHSIHPNTEWSWA